MEKERVQNLIKELEEAPMAWYTEEGYACFGYVLTKTEAEYVRQLLIERE